jgi:ABC-type lipoprotein export system ATPase subunit
MRNIKNIEVLKSNFFDSTLKINFSKNLTCIMGGRGTGKSTILFFIKSCLELNAEDDRDTFNILKNNLGDGIIKLYMETDEGEKYTIEKSFGEEPQPYFGVEPDTNLLPLETINNELSCDIFPAQIIEEIGRNSGARLELIDKMAFDETNELKFKVETTQNNLEKNAKDIRIQNQRIKRAKDILKDYTKVEQDFKEHKKNKPKGINKKAEIEFNKQDIAEKVRISESKFLSNLSENLESFLENYLELNEDLKSINESTLKSKDFMNKTIVQPIVTKVEKYIFSVTKSNIENIENLKSFLNDLKKTQKSLKIKHDQQQNQFIKLKQTLDKHKKYYDKLNLLSKKVTEKGMKIQEIDDLTEKREKLKLKRINLIKELNNLKKNIYDLRLKKITELNKIFEGQIKIILTPGGITEEFETGLKNALKGNNIRYNTIIPQIVQNFTPDRFASIIHQNDSKKLSLISNIDIEKSKLLLDILYESEFIYNIESIYCQDLPDFHLRVEQKFKNGINDSKVRYKKSDELSTGQRCTTVLPIIFAISKNPLIIDQPEDNLDNKYISETIHKIINEQKQKRQLIFITHNANIPVLSNSEQNIFLQYENQKSSVSHKGDVDTVKNEILHLLEGGKDAFEKRKILYGV